MSRIIIAKNSILAIIIQGILWGLFFYFLFCFLFERCQICQEVLSFDARGTVPLFFFTGIFACTEPYPSLGDNTALAVYWGSQVLLQPVFTTCAALGLFGCPFPRTSLYSLRTHSPEVFSPKTHDFESVRRPRRTMWHTIPGPSGLYLLQCGHAQPEIRPDEAGFCEDSRSVNCIYLEHRTLASVVKASQNCYSNKISSVYAVLIICPAFT